MPIPARNHDLENAMQSMYETTIYYRQEDLINPFEARFHVLAENETHAATLARELMRESYAAEINDSAYLARGATWLVPGVKVPKRLRVPTRRR